LRAKVKVAIVIKISLLQDMKKKESKDLLEFKLAGDPS